MIPLLAAEIDNNTLLGAGAIGTLGLLLFLMKFQAALKNHIFDMVSQLVKQKPEGREILGQPVQIEMAKQFMTRDDHRQVCGGLERRVSSLEVRADRADVRMEDAQHKILAAGEDRATKIHERINDIDRKVAGLDERTIATNTTLAVQSKKLDAILERL
jgi:hypothetical protein